MLKTSNRMLITGAAGFIGSHALRHFWENLGGGWEYVVVDNLNYAASLDRIAGFGDRLAGFRDNTRNFKFVLHDLRAAPTDALRKQIDEVDVVVHFAAETHVDRSMVDPKPFIESNIIGTYNLLEFCREHQSRLRMFYYVSTDESYGAAPVGVDHKEDAPHRPSNPYSASKAAAEDLVYAWNHSMGVPAIITNTMNNIGETQHPEKYLPKIIRCLLSGDVITVHGSPDDPGSRKYLYARDHADAIVFLMQHGRRGEKYNVVGATEITNLELVRKIERSLSHEFGYNVEPKIKFVDFHSTRPGHDRRYSLDGGKMASMGWTPPTPIDEAIRKCVKWTLENREWL